MTKEPSGASILVVDDDPEILAMLSTRFASRGYTVLTAGDGNQAIEVAKRARPELVVLDVMMPGKSGWEVARALKQDPVTEGVKILILTAQGSLNQLTSSLYADAFVDKPFEFEALEKTIRDLLGRD
jgi:DNA-binding response OmpR family regulator